MVQNKKEEFMEKIMFVCAGNTSRSAMAEAMLNDKVEKDEALKGKVSACSCGVYAENGDPASDLATLIMKEHGIDITRHRATEIIHSKIEDMDLVLCAETIHKTLVLIDYPALKGKVYTLKEYIKDYSDDINIHDPHGGNLDAYRQCAAETETCLDKLVEQLKTLQG
jgi:protein-tyrosine phosphatase